MTIQDITKFLDEKIEENEDYIVAHVYELRVTNGLSENEVNKFLELARIRLLNLNYQVYFTGAKYKYNGIEKVVQSNEYMVAIKE